jgi:hypothetical protein
MPLVINDRVLETSTSSGTSAMTLLGAVQDYQTFATGIGGNNTTYYTIANPNTNEWETGLGTLNGGGTVLTRTTVYRSSNSNTAVTFSAGTKLVFCDYIAARAVYLSPTGVLQIGDAGASFPNALALFYSNVNSYSQLVAQNNNAGILASTDFVATANNGSDTANYIDMGINSSLYSDVTYSIVGPNDGYLYVNGSVTGGDLAIGTVFPSHAIKFFQDGTTAADEVARFAPTSNNFLVGTTVDSASKIRALGIIESTGSGNGFRFPDGTLQTTANQNWRIVRNGIAVGVLAPFTTTPLFPVQSYTFSFADAGALTTSIISIVPSAETFVVLPDISTGTVLGLIGTITFSAAHNLANGNSITISGASPSGWNGTWVTTFVNATQVTITFVSAPGTYVSGATTIATTTASGPVLGGDELEMDGITCAANCNTAGTVDVYISSVNGAPLLGLRNFNYSIS